ncbi:MAG: NADH-quinone oxidoreductase subunit E [Marinilabiliales bacterium]|nr:MAG: NADH-quinone oxidoreductase subunit E [Marinilabiliales bacterium]
MDRNDVVKRYEPVKDNMLNILHELQNNNPSNYLTTEDLKWVAEYLNTTYSSVYGVVRYYSMFSLKPRGKFVIRVCNSPLCHMVDDDKLIQSIKNQLSIGLDETTDDSLFSLESSECLGHCAEAPVMMINDKVYKNLNSSKIENIFQSIRSNEKNKKL